MSVLEKGGRLEKAHRTEIITSITLRILDRTRHPTPKEYNIAGRMLVEKYPFLLVMGPGNSAAPKIQEFEAA